MTYPGTPDHVQEPAEEQEQQRRSPMPVDPAVGVAVGGALGLAVLLWLLSRLRLRRQQPHTPSEKLVQAGREASSAVGHQASRLAGEAAEAAEKAAAAATPVVLAGAGVLAKESRRVGERAAEMGTHAAQAGAHASENVVETLEHAQRRVSRFFLKILAALSFGGGYVLGAQAGRERYDQIVRSADQLRSRLTG